MNRGDAYSLLAIRLNELRETRYDALLLRVGQPASCETLLVNGEPIEIGVAVSWADQKQCRLRVHATACGPSTWTIERLEESFLIGPDAK